MASAEGNKFKYRSTGVKIMKFEDTPERVLFVEADF
jgi:hypothetical protein